MEKQKTPAAPGGVEQRKDGREKQEWRGLSCGLSCRGAAEEVGPGSLGFESQRLLPSVRGPWLLGPPGQVCVWERLFWGHAEEGKEGRECGTLVG